MRLKRTITVFAAALAAVALPFVAGANAETSAPSRAPHMSLAMSPDWWACVEAAEEVGPMINAPDQLLIAIALNETGRRAPNRALAPWPWTINVGGHGYEFATKDQAVFAARQLLNSGTRNFDVGCMQVNVRFHPRAFTSLEEAFDPLANMLYAADFIDRLQSRNGSWNRAVELYHSYNDEFNQVYGMRFQGFWDLARRRAARGDILMSARAPELMGQRAGFVELDEINRRGETIDFAALGAFRDGRTPTRNGRGDPALTLTPMVATLLMSDEGTAPLTPRLIRAGLSTREAAILRQVEQQAIETDG